LPIITLDERDVTDSAAYEQLYAENALLRSERDSLRSSVERLQKELTAVSELLAQQQREMELLLPWLPTPSDEK
jgi:predicted  nucleic acid-binding Zn-ribbon protein